MKTDLTYTARHTSPGLPLVWTNEMKEARIASKHPVKRPSLETAPTEFIENAGITFAYRVADERRSDLPLSDFPDAGRN